MTESRPVDRAEAVRREFNSEAAVRAYAEGRAAGLMGLERRALSEFLPAGGRLLDLGCGAGREALAGAGDGRDLVACDSAAAMCRAARMAFRTAGRGWPVVVADARHLPFRTALFDSVLATNALIQYVPLRRGRRAVLGDVRRILRPGGRAAFQVRHLGLSPTAPGYLGPARVRNALRTAFGLGMVALNALHNLFRRIAAAAEGSRYRGLEPGDFVAGAGSFPFFHQYVAGEFRSDTAAAGLRLAAEIEELPTGPGGRSARFPAMHSWDALIVCERLA